MIILKNERQLQGIRASAAILSALHAELQNFVDVGVTTGEIDAFSHDFIIRHRAVPTFLGYMDFPSSTCISVNEEVIHGLPGNRKLLSGDIVSIDIGVTLDGYISDAAQTIMVGDVVPEVRKLVDITRECLDSAIEKAASARRIHELSRTVYNLANANGYGVVREYCGHGVGIELHEEPQIPNYVSIGPNPRIRPGMVFAIEPMINLGSSKIEHLDDGWTVVTADRLPSAHWEHTIAIHGDHVEVLTAF